jgi:acyl transferase domain-containing protein
MDPVLGELEGAAREVSFRPPATRLVSNLTGCFVREEVCDATYWRRHAREVVRFGEGMTTLWEHGCRVFVEVGPSPALLGVGQRSFAERSAKWLPSLRPGCGDWAQMLKTLGELYATTRVGV